MSASTVCRPTTPACSPASPPWRAYYEATVEAAGTPAETAKPAANWIITDLLGALNKAGSTIATSPVTAAHMAGLLTRLADKTISGKIAKEVFEAMLAGEGTADEIIKSRGLVQITDESAIQTAIQGVMGRQSEDGGRLPERQGQAVRLFSSARR